jgi:hypothetical protein
MFWLIHSICNHDVPMTSSKDEVASTLEAVVGWLLADGYLTLRTDSEGVSSTTCRLSSAHSLSHGSSWSETFVFGTVELRNSLVPDTCSKLDVVAWAGDCFAQVLVSITERFGYDSILTCRHLRSTAMLNCCAAVCMRFYAAFLSRVPFSFCRQVDIVPVERLLYCGVTAWVCDQAEDEAMDPWAFLPLKFVDFVDSLATTRVVKGNFDRFMRDPDMSFNGNSNMILNRNRIRSIYEGDTAKVFEEVLCAWGSHLDFAHHARGTPSHLLQDLFMRCMSALALQGMDSAAKLLWMGRAVWCLQRFACVLQPWLWSPRRTVGTFPHLDWQLLLVETHCSKMLEACVSCLRSASVVDDTTVDMASTLAMSIAFLLENVSKQPVLECIVKCLGRVCEDSGCGSVSRSIVWAVCRVLRRTMPDTDESLALCASPSLHLFLADRAQADCHREEPFSQAITASACVLLNTLSHNGTLRTHGQSLLEALVPRLSSLSLCLETLSRLEISCPLSKASLVSWVALYQAASSEHLKHLFAARLGPLVYKFDDCGCYHSKWTSVHAHALGAQDLWRTPVNAPITAESCGLVFSIMKLELVILAGAYRCCVAAIDFEEGRLWAKKDYSWRRGHNFVASLRRSVQLLNDQDGPAVVALSALISTCVHMAKETFDDGWCTVRTYRRHA